MGGYYRYDSGSKINSFESHSDVDSRPQDPNAAAYMRDLQDEQKARRLAEHVVAYNGGKIVASAKSEEVLVSALLKKKDLEGRVLVVLFGTNDARIFTPDQIIAMGQRRR